MFSGGLESEDLSDVVCDPCLEDGELYNAVGMCIECQDHLCQRCFDGHKIARPFRRHSLFDKQQMLQSAVPLKRKDQSTEICDVHKDEVINFYCRNHSKLGCGVCIKLNHSLCDQMTYIPHAAKDLANNEEYQLADSQLKYVVERSKKLNDNYKQITESIEKDCKEAIKSIHEFRSEINGALNKLEADLVRKCETLKSEETKRLAKAEDMSKTVHTELQELIAKVEMYQNHKQNCKLYKYMMASKDKLKLVVEKIKEAENEQPSVTNQIKFIANNETHNMLQHSDAFGYLSMSSTTRALRTDETMLSMGETGTTVTGEGEGTLIVKTEYVKDINVKSLGDKQSCLITGMTGLSDNRLFIADFNNGATGNGNVKLVDVKLGHVISYLQLSSPPWDATKIKGDQVAVTLPHGKKVVMVNVSASGLTVDYTLDVNGECRGVDYKDDKLAVSFSYPYNVQILTLQGRVLYNITNDTQGQTLFCNPCYVVLDQDKSLFVSNLGNDNVVHVGFDGTVLGTYTDRQLRVCRSLLTDRSGNIYACGEDSHNIHQFSPDCEKIRLILTKADGLAKPLSFTYTEAENLLCVGMFNYNVVKVYRMTLGTSSLQ